MPLSASRCRQRIGNLHQIRYIMTIEVIDLEFRFHIDGSFSPATIPMERLAEYMKAMAQLLGETTNVHFAQVTTGSVVMHAKIDPPAEVKVVDRITAIRHQRSPREATRAFEILDELLRKDNATGR